MKGARAMPSLEELIAIGLEQMANPAYIGLIVMILMQGVGKAGLGEIRKLITGRDEEDWPARAVVINSVSLTLCLLLAVVFAAPGTQVREALLRGAISLPIAIGEYEVVKNIVRALGYKWS
jgi:hypothetical protein